MIDQITFANSTWIVAVVIAAVILLAVFAWKEWSQSGKHRFLLKIFIAIMAVTSLALMALKPEVPVSTEISRGVLITDAYEKAQLDSLKKVHKNLVSLNYEINKPLQEEVKHLDSVFLLGRGIQAFDLWQLEKVPAIYLGGNEPVGVMKLNYDQSLSVGDQLKLMGLYNKPKAGNRLILEGAGGIALDSIELIAEEDQRFQLMDEVEGDYLYSLVEKDSLGNIISSDPIPVKIESKSPLKILIINSFPTFETKYLKNFLAEKGHQVVIRSQITRGRFKYEYFNTERISIGNLSKEQLDSFDLLLIDAASLRLLSEREQNTMENSLQNGLGIFVQADNSYFTSFGKLGNFRFIQDLTSEGSIAEWPNIGIEKYPFLLENQFALQSVHSSEERIYSAAKQVGKGRIGTSLFQNTWKLLLEGQTQAYQQLWTSIIEKLGRKEIPLSEWESGMIGIQDQPFDFKLRTTLLDPEVRNSEGSVIPLKRDLDIPSLWEGTIFPRNKGWNKLILQQDTTQVFQYFVADTAQWRSLEAYETMQENRRYFERQELAGEVDRKLEPINPLWFFLVFILSMGGLWLEPKL